ncbi:MAG: glycosyltransferase, partial [Chloroflexi bacterium]|nr:glycosyltransferase [Chloroflexota bacterium]
MSDLSVVIVSWNVRALLERCLSSLQKCHEQGRLECEIIVVDNASSDGSAQMVSQCFPAVRLIASDSNLGFARGNNMGVAH